MFDVTLYEEQESIYVILKQGERFFSHLHSPARTFLKIVCRIDMGNEIIENCQQN